MSDWGNKMRMKLIVLFVMIFSIYTQVTIAQSEIEAKDKFNLAYESLKEIHHCYTTDVMKSLAFLLICIGWFITSNKSRDFIKNNKIVRISGIVALLIIGIIHIREQINTYMSSQHIVSDLSNMNYLDMKYYEHYEINLGQLTANSIMNIVLFVVLILIIFSLKKVREKL